MSKNKYTDKLPAKVIDLFKQGYTKARICLALDINKSTFLLYMEKHKAFREAVDNGRYFSLGYWQGVAANIATGANPDGNIRATEAMLSNMFPESWQRGQINMNAKLETKGKDDMKAVYDAMTPKEHVALKKLKIAEAKMIQKTNNRMKKKEGD